MIRLHDTIARNAWRDPGGDACVDPASGRRLTHGALADRAGRLATAMVRRLGLAPGERIAILARNTAEYLELFMAAAATGVVTVPLNWRLSPPELVRVLEDATPRALFHTSDFASQVEALQGAVDVAHWVRFDPGEDSPYEDLVTTPRDDALVAGGRFGDDDPLFVLYTGGTTGVSKGVLHSHRSAWTAMCNQDHAERVQPDDVYLLLGQMFHIPIVLAFNYLSRGCPVVLLSFDATATLQVIEQERVTGFLGVTTMLNHLLAVEDIDSYDLSSLRIVQYGGGPMGEDVVRAALDALPCDLMQGYGQTEGGTMTFLSPQVHRDAVAGIAPHRLRSCGQEALLSDVRLVDPEDGRPVPRDGETVGEIVTRSDANMLRYWNRPDVTAETLRNGWIHTGDLATWDGDGFFYIKDRKKDLIITGGENVYPAQVENALYAHPAVLECAVFGVPDDVWGEAVKAVVTVKPGHSVTEQELIDLARENLASYMKPKSVDFVDEMPTSPTGKLLKRELRDPYWEGTGRDI